MREKETLWLCVCVYACHRSRESACVCERERERGISWFICLFLNEFVPRGTKTLALQQNVNATKWGVQYAHVHNCCKLGWLVMELFTRIYRIMLLKLSYHRCAMEFSNWNFRNVLRLKFLKIFEKNVEGLEFSNFYKALFGPTSTKIFMFFEVQLNLSATTTLGTQT